MEYDKDKVDEVVLALLYLNMSGEYRAWKSFGWDTMDRLYEKGMISDPKSKAKSVLLSEEGFVESKRLFEKYFSIETPKK